jgi:hypothetical protein
VKTSVALKCNPPHQKQLNELLFYWHKYALLDLYKFMHIKASPLLYKDVSQSWVMNGWRCALLSYGLFLA